MKKIIIINCLILICVLSAGCTYYAPVPDFDQAEIKLKHTLKLPAGFSIESSVPLKLEKMQKEGIKNPQQFFEGDKFSLFSNIKYKGDQKKQNTKVKIDYDQKYIEYLYIYDKLGNPLEYLGNGFYEFDKEVLPGQEVELYITGLIQDIEEKIETGITGMSQSIEKNSEPSMIGFNISFLDQEEQVLDTEEFPLTIYKKD